MLRVDNIKAGCGSLEVLHGVSQEVREREISASLGRAR